MITNKSIESRIALKIPIRNLPFYVSKTKNSLKKLAKNSDILDQISMLPSFVQYVIKNHTSFSYRDLEYLPRNMKEEINFLESSERDIGFMFRNLKEFGRYLPKSCRDIAEYVVSDSFLDDLTEDGSYPKNDSYPDETVSDNELRGLLESAKALISFYQIIDTFKDRVQVYERNEASLEAGSTETLYHVSINAKSIYTNGFSLTMPEENSGLGLGGESIHEELSGRDFIHL